MHQLYVSRSRMIDVFQSNEYRRKCTVTFAKLGKKGGLKGGPARAAKMTAEERSASARAAVQARWSKSKGTQRDDFIPGKLRQATQKNVYKQVAQEKDLGRCVQKHLRGAKS